MPIIITKITNPWSSGIFIRSSSMVFLFFSDAITEKNQLIIAPAEWDSNRSTKSQKNYNKEITISKKKTNPAVKFKILIFCKDIFSL